MAALQEKSKSDSSISGLWSAQYRSPNIPTYFLPCSHLFSKSNEVGARARHSYTIFQGPYSDHCITCADVPCQNPRFKVSSWGYLIYIARISQNLGICTENIPNSFIRTLIMPIGLRTIYCKVLSVFSVSSNGLICNYNLMSVGGFILRRYRAVWKHILVCSMVNVT
ncbi:hypothetical protein BCR34DRAFT_233049 [Clohesyomyces aquaticus]|uniref:Uncharacterized protein n=1 Tax=Clohesyomyces aquaticus TaxID=1231657 RepID=A0A1Y1ZVZ8_9PLEO|nr:hypothetical protein BCR34DRAFT_233049 [Clohesyomyces aquaticus]